MSRRRRMKAADLEAIRAEEKRNFARKMLRDYADPPEGGVLVPLAWVEENLADLIRNAEL